MRSEVIPFFLIVIKDSSIYSFATTRMSDYDNHYFGSSVKENTRWGGKVSFNTANGCKFYVYPYEDYTVTPVRAISAYPVDSTGSVVRTGNEVNFLIEPPEGMLVNSVSVRQDTGYVSFCDSEVTGAENVYRITDITSFLDVDVELAEIPSGYDVTFDCGGNADVYVFAGSDYIQVPVLSDTAVSTDSDTGIPTKSGDGQVNFMIVPHGNYAVTSVEITPANYKNLKTPEDTGNENTYRITKITGNLTVTVTLEETVPDYIPGDVDADGKITVKDVNLMKAIILGSVSGSEGTVAAADVNCDGKTDLRDMNMLKQMLLGSAV